VIKSAELVRCVTDEEAFDTFAVDRLEAAAGVKQRVMKFVQTHPGFRLVEPRFTPNFRLAGFPIGWALHKKLLN
jgi:hypothetical protein